MDIKLEFEREIDGRWIAEIPSMPGAMAYGQTQTEATRKAQAIALRYIAAQLESDENESCLTDLKFYQDGSEIRQSGSQRILIKHGFKPFIFAFHDNEEIGPRMLARIAKHTGLLPDDL